MRTINSVPIYPKMPAQTGRQAKLFSLDMPIRCEVDETRQHVISAEPFDRDRFLLHPAVVEDQLPEYKIKGFKTDQKPLDEALRCLLENTDIRVNAREAVYPVVSLPEVEGRLDQTVNMLTELGNVYSSYDAHTKTLTLQNEIKWRLDVPLSDELLVGVLDALRGGGIKNVVVDWEDRALLFTGNKLIEKKVRHIINEMAVSEYWIAYDVHVYRVYPKSATGVPWMNILKSFSRQDVKVSIPGLIGRALVTSPAINSETLKTFLRPYGRVVPISEGTFIAPSKWQGRFDVGLCSTEDRLETDLKILTQATYRPNAFEKDHVDLDFVLRTKEGEIASFDLPARLNENVVVMGVPTHYFIKGESTIIPPQAELMMVLSPRLINIVDMRQADED
ncbi:MAG: hypothetical protein JXR30_02310 [Alphaproteobacteria bacterium]|nr:hypothetical protein [Alphaproteobacteria bacterium]